MPATAREPKLFAFDVALARDHLDASIERNCSRCAVALAVSEAVGSHRMVGVAIDGRIFVRPYAGARHSEAAVDEAARVAAIVRMVDAGRGDEVAPTAFKIWCNFPPEE